MSKKGMISIVAIIIIVAVGLGGYFWLSNQDKTPEGKTTVKENTEANKENQESETPKEDTPSNKKILVAYYSASGSTKGVAEQIAQNLNADLFEIVPEEVYTREDLNYGDSNSRVSKEHDDESLRDVKLKTTKVEGWDTYDTVLIGYPIWWGVAAWPVDTFIKSNNFEGKTIIPFCTSASSGLGQSGELLEALANGGDWLAGRRFSSRPSDSEILSFTDSIK